MRQRVGISEGEAPESPENVTSEPAAGEGEEAAETNHYHPDAQPYDQQPEKARVHPYPIIV
ncbi:hypothetical protein BH23GEM3_BH23GEM3_04380 [soil metagenome]